MSVVYKLTFNASGQYYIGSTGNLDKRILQHMHDMSLGVHASSRMNDCYAKYGFDFVVTVLHETDSRQEAYMLENAELQAAKRAELLLNTAVTAKFGDTITHNPKYAEICKHISEGVKRRNAQMPADKYIQLYVTSKLGARNGRYIDGRCLVVNRCPVCNCIISVNATTCPRHVNRYGSNNNFFGRHHTDETKAKIRAKNVGKLPTNVRQVSINSVIYASVTDAARQLHVAPGTIVHRCKSVNYPDTFYVSV